MITKLPEDGASAVVAENGRSSCKYKCINITVFDIIFLYAYLIFEYKYYVCTL